jgi:hypothetical protein
MKTLKLNLALLFSIALLAGVTSSCKKKKTEDAANTPVIEEPIPQPDTAFKTFMKASDFVPAGNTIQSMTYEPNTKNLFFYLKKSVNTGYAILQLNTETKQSLIVYNSNDVNWSNSNGSEGRRIRAVGNDLYVMGGATNTMIHRLSGVSNNGLTFVSAISVPNNLGGSPYDVTIKSNTMYVMTMNNKIAYGNFTLSNAAAYAISSTSHGSSIASAGNFLISSGGSAGAGLIELRNLATGVLIRSVSLPTATSSSLEVDVNNKIILVHASKIYRYAYDLLSKEEFKAIGASDYYQIALADEGDKTRIYEFDGAELKTMTIKN